MFINFSGSITNIKSPLLFVDVVGCVAFVGCVAVVVAVVVTVACKLVPEIRGPKKELDKTLAKISTTNANKNPIINVNLYSLSFYFWKFFVFGELFKYKCK